MKPSMGGESKFKMDIINGEVVDHNDNEGKPPKSWKPGIFIDRDLAESIKKESFSLGIKAAHTVYTEEGRQRSSALIAKIKKKLRTSLFTVVRPSMIIYNLKDPSNLYLADSEAEHARLLGRAISFVTGSSINSNVDTVNALKLNIQNRGFSEGFNSIVDICPFKDERIEDRPWYLKPQSTNVGNF